MQPGFRIAGPEALCSIVPGPLWQHPPRRTTLYRSSQIPVPSRSAHGLSSRLSPCPFSPQLHGFSGTTAIAHGWKSKTPCCPPSASFRGLGEGDLSRGDLPNRVQEVAKFCDAFWRFSRPHTILGTTISVVSVSLLALQGLQVSPQAITALFQALAAALLANVSIVGLNQVFDIEIDRVNKPYLPLASGEFSVATGITIVVVTGILALAASLMSGSPPLVATVTLSLVLGFLYSTDLPFMRWKKFPFLAAGCILAVRAVLVQLGFFYHIKMGMGSAQIAVTPALTFTLGFMLFFSVVIALFKDIPDVKGDDKAGVRTFSVQYGVDRVFWICITLLLVAYAGGVAYGTLATAWSNKLITCCGHAILGGLLWVKSSKVNLTKKADITAHYMFIWKLFYAEYLLIPFL